MNIYDELQQQPEVERQPDYGLYFMIFMIVFWPVSLVLGLIDYCLVPAYDLRLVNLVLGALIGWIGVVVYRRRTESAAAG